ncbi:RsbT co-antagonist protein RsbRA [Enhygromyxa salina]|uniref:RsbT co-antagonist protein RsbRA n=1 Tax=Enhygromyxa salina TaxID=215803 RepID=A0A2S9YKX2_9BACT|nr:STAS domain-containing protein [Enhygromyxa salina]PRQ05749.1 RsbT co-antagonist protein RsbRA [Enhygromyxa salina]
MGEDSLAARNHRLVSGMQFMQLMTRTFSTLQLTTHDAIADTLSSLTGSFFECRSRLALLVNGDTGELRVAAREGLGGAELLSEAGRALWSWVMAEKTALALTAEQLRERWPDAPAALSEGMACVAIELHDESLGVLAVAGKLSYKPFNDEELTFLSCASGLASMAVANANANAEQDAQRQLAEARAAQAAEQTREKQATLVELDRKLAIIEAQRARIDELSIPILQLRDQVLAVPLIGAVDAQRSADLMEQLMTEISRQGARFVILDITGVELVDTHTADHFIRVARTAALLGALCIVTGVRPAVAQTLVGLGADLSSLVTKATLGDGLDECERRLARTLSP